MSPKKSRRIVTYYRVSTQKQGRSGLGLDGQRTVVAGYVAANGCTELGAYTEVETGTKMRLDNRPELAKALAHAKRSKAVLVIAVLDRLGRNVAFISTLMESGVEFVCADSPNDDRFILHVKASMAEEEGRKISERTRRALSEAKERGVKLGTDNLTREGTLKGVASSVAVRRERKAEAYAHILPTILECKAQGVSLHEIAKRLNAAGEETRSGKNWNPVQVSRVLKSVEWTQH
jgi:DNA invertase Pin-like site-specific DNA recombinase